MAAKQVHGSTAPALDIARIDKTLAGTIFQGKLHHFTTVESTQTIAIADAQANVAAGQVYIADAQTAGRGRGGHTWTSPREEGLYLTVLTRPTLEAVQALCLSLATGLAAQAAIRQVADTYIDLRWPNDLVSPGPDSRKLGGILTETAMHPGGTLRYAAIGIGINLNQAAMPQKIEPIATSLFRLAGRRVERADLLSALLLRLDRELREVTANPAQVLKRFAAASSWVNGKMVRVAEEEGYTGTTAGLDGAGLLRVQCEDGTLRTVRHGGVREVY